MVEVNEISEYIWLIWLYLVILNSLWHMLGFQINYFVFSAHNFVEFIYVLDV